MTTVPLLTLNNGVEIPALGFGVFQTPPDETFAAVGTALATGYRHIDTAAAYGNEREVGEAIRRSGLDRSEVFVGTKIWISDYGYWESMTVGKRVDVDGPVFRSPRRRVGAVACRWSSRGGRSRPC